MLSRLDIDPSHSSVSEESCEGLRQRLEIMLQENDSLTNELGLVKKEVRLLAKEKDVLLDKLCKYRVDRRDADKDRHVEERLIHAERCYAETETPQSVFSFQETDKGDIWSLPPFESNMIPHRSKRVRRGHAEPRIRSVQPLERDPDTGAYKLPVRVGILTVHSLGRVLPLPTYHSDRYIWPPGYCVSRTYLSMVNKNENTVYTCKVEENGEQGPKFCAVASDCPKTPIVSNSATGVWTTIVKRANEIRNREHSNSASGPDYYGFTNATIAKMIQDLPGAEQCLNYVWKEFGVMQQRTAAGVAAATEKKLNNLKIMGSANKKAPFQPLEDHPVQ